MSCAAEELLQAVLRTAGGPVARAAVIGICKNAGKTTALNALIQAATAAGVRLAVLSTGRDGEEIDAITDLPKPRIHVPAGTWVATARAALGHGTARVDVLQELPDLSTPLGPVVLGQVAGAGNVLLMGPGSAGRVRDLLRELAARRAAAGSPAGLYLVDGSFNRVAAAAPGVTDAMVLAVGAAFSPSLKATVAEAGHLLNLFSCPPVDAGRRVAVMQAMAVHAVSWVWPSGDAEPLAAPSALSEGQQVIAEAAERLVRLGPAVGTDPLPLLVLAGAVTDHLLRALLQHPAVTRQVGLVVRDATRLLVDRGLWRRFRRQGGWAGVVDPIRVAAVTGNPWSPFGPGYPATEFLQALAAAADGLPVIDVESGLVEVMASGNPQTGTERGTY